MQIKHHARFLIYTILMVLHTSSLFGVEQLKEGNLALRGSLQPGPLFAIGQNIFDKKEVMIQETLVFQRGRQFNTGILFNGIIYAPTANSSLYTIVPVTLFDHIGPLKSKGLNDLFVQGEYCYYKKDARTYTAELTVLGDVFWPTGQIDKPIPQGNGSMSFYVGGTASITHVDWYLFADAGAILTTRNNRTKFGEIVLYEWGIGHNLGNPYNSVLLGMLAFNGIYSRPDVIAGVKNENTGGNIIFLGGELYFSHDPYVFQFGIQWPIYKKLNGIQPAPSYRFGIALSWVFK